MICIEFTVSKAWFQFFPFVYSRLVFLDVPQLISGKGLRSEYERPPYIAAKWPQRTIPFTFDLGSGETFEGFVNRKLERGVRYKVFVRAVVDAPQKVSYSD